MMLRRPLQVYGVRTIGEYLTCQARQLEARGRGRPFEAEQLPFDSPDKPTVYVGCGKWLVRCVCGDCPSVNPEWRIACCLGCGARYSELIIPENYLALEAVLVKRRIVNQNWCPPETVEDLIAQNVAHGDPVP